MLTGEDDLAGEEELEWPGATGCCSGSGHWREMCSHAGGPAPSLRVSDRCSHTPSHNRYKSVRSSCECESEKCLKDPFHLTLYHVTTELRLLAGTNSWLDAAAAQVCIAVMPRNWQLQARVISSCLLDSSSSSYIPETCFVLVGWHLPLAVALTAAPALAGFSHAGSLLSIS